MTTTDFNVFYQHIPEIPVEGKPLGRHIRHDSRSLSYLVEEADPATFQTKEWSRTVPPFDQGATGSCTGNASVGSLATSPHVEVLRDQIDAGKLSLDESEALAVYSAATALDGFTGTYPPDDTGSDGLSVAKVLTGKSWISGYVHATSLNAMITALQSGPVIVGVNWYEGFDNPDANGHVTVSGASRGGHEFEVLGVNVENKTFTAINSWGPTFGVNGRFTFSWDDMTRLLAERGDCTQLIPLSAPAPTPTPPQPTPVPTPPAPVPTADKNLVDAGNAWSRAIFSPFSKSGRVKSAFLAWKTEHNY
jgi:hypothetical protein